MSNLTRDGTAEPVSRDQKNLRRERAQGKNIFTPVQLITSRNGNLAIPIPLSLSLLKRLTDYIMCIIICIISC